jgi:glyoxylase-like metal-dependent hydrolase (beta-lactamase superfamily II)
VNRQHPAYGEPREVTPYASVLLAHNPGPMTLEGTNTWLVRAPGASTCVVVDPGPGDTDHLRRVAEHGPVSLILLTHHHFDHAEGAPEIAELTGAPVRARDPELCVGADPLEDEEVIDAAGVPLRVLVTPGHSSDSVCFGAELDGVSAVFTGDSVLGRGTTVVAHPDGQLGPYLASLRRLSEFSSAAVLPGHGPDLPDTAATAKDYLVHREQRLDQIRSVLHEHGPALTARQVVEIVYADVDRSVWGAAESSVQAQLAYLREHEES